MSGVRPSIGGSIVPTAAQGGLLKRRVPLLGGTGRLPLNGRYIDPGPWKLNIYSAFTSPGGGGGGLWYDVGFYPPGSNEHTLGGSSAAGTGVNNIFPSGGGGNWYQPAAFGVGAAGAAVYAGGCSYLWGGATQFQSDVGFWQGPGGARWWMGLGSDAAPDGGIFRIEVPDAMDTRAPGYGPTWGPGSDLLADFDNPIVLVAFRSAQANFIDAQFPTEYEPPAPAMPLSAGYGNGLPGGGGAVVTVYNNVTSMTFLTTSFDISDVTQYESGPVGQEVVHGSIVPWGGMSFWNVAGFCWVDITQPPLAVTSLVAGAADSGLVVVG